jgi:predicted transcriptional regulator
VYCDGKTLSINCYYVALYIIQASEELEGERCQHSVAELTKRLEESEKKVQQLTLESKELQKQVNDMILSAM